MRIAVVSDTHGHLENLSRVREQLGKVDWLLHAGDHFRDAPAAAEMLGLPPERVVAVVGNCDYPMTQPAEHVLDFDGVRMLLTHGHLYGVKRSPQRIWLRGRELGVAAVVFGHTHIAVCDQDAGVLLFNPGSLSAPRRRSTPPSCGLLEIIEGRLTARHIWVG